LSGLGVFSKIIDNQRKRLEMERTFKIFLGFIALSIESEEMLPEIRTTLHHTDEDDEEEEF
jgi:hypothetical protein